MPSFSIRMATLVTRLSAAIVHIITEVEKKMPNTTESEFDAELGAYTEAVAAYVGAVDAFVARHASDVNLSDEMESLRLAKAALIEAVARVPAEG